MSFGSVGHRAGDEGGGAVLHRVRVLEDLAVAISVVVDQALLVSLQGLAGSGHATLMYHLYLIALRHNTREHHILASKIVRVVLCLLTQLQSLLRARAYLLSPQRVHMRRRRDHLLMKNDRRVRVLITAHRCWLLLQPRL